MTIRTFQKRAYRQPLDLVYVSTTAPVYLAASAVMYSSCQIWSNASRHNLEIQLVRQIENPLNLHHNCVSTISPSQSDHHPPHSRHPTQFLHPDATPRANWDWNLWMLIEYLIFVVSLYITYWTQDLPLLLNTVGWSAKTEMYVVTVTAYLPSLLNFYFLLLFSFSDIKKAREEEYH